MAPMKQIILLAHGSPDPRSGKAIQKFALKIQNQLGLPTEVAFLDHEEPTLPGIAKYADPDDVLVVPMLLSNAFHARFDVPKAMREAGLTRILPPIGHPLEILTALIRVAGPHVIVVAAGSTNESARQLFQDAVKLASMKSGIDAEPAYVTGSDLSLGSQLLSMQRSTSGRINIIPWLLAEGRLLDTIRVEAHDKGALVEGCGLVAERAFLQHIISSIALSDFCNLSLV